MIWEILLILFIGLIIASKQNIKLQGSVVILIICVVLYCRLNTKEFFDTASDSVSFSNAPVNTAGLYCSSNSDCGANYKCSGIKNNIELIKIGKCTNPVGLECAYDDQCAPPYKCEGVIKKQVNSGHSQFIVKQQGLCTDSTGKTYNPWGFDTDCKSNSQTCIGSSIKQSNVTSYGFCVYNGSGPDPGKSPMLSALFPGIEGSYCNIDYDCSIPGYLTPYTCEDNKCMNTK